MGFYFQSASFNAWRRPTLPGLEPQYHRRRLVSRPSSGWDRVGHRRYGHQAMKLALWVLIDAVHISGVELVIWLEVDHHIADAMLLPALSLMVGLASLEAFKRDQSN